MHFEELGSKNDFPSADLPNFRQTSSPSTQSHSFDLRTLPIVSYLDQIVSTIHENQITIIEAETGSGKSTMVAKALIDTYGAPSSTIAGLQMDSKFRAVVTQPRIMAARELATYVSQLHGTELGEKIGYRSSLERCDSRDTRLLYVTDGLQLVRELFRNAGRRDVLVLDEVHEWNINIEVLAAWARREINRGSKFKLVVMSATIDTQKLADYFGTDGSPAPVIHVPGRLFNIEHQARGESIEADALRLAREGKNVLIFQPTKAAIEKTLLALRRSKINAELLPLHAEQEFYEQERCFKSYDRPKIIVATNVAKTSITIPDIDAVIDSGLELQSGIDGGVEELLIKVISQADALQRGGRGARTHDGIYIDHCPVALEKRPRFGTPEIYRDHLGPSYLRLRMVDEELERLRCFHEVEPDDVITTRESLRVLGCLDHEGDITDIGRQIATLPVSEQAGRMIVEARLQGVLEYFPTIIAAYENKGMRDPDSNKWRSLIGSENESDFIAEYALVQAAASCKTREDFLSRGLHQKHYQKICEVRDRLSEKLGISKEKELPLTIPEEARVAVLKSIGAGLIEHIYTVNSDRECTPKGASEHVRILNKHSCVATGGIIVGRPLNITSHYGQSQAIELVGWASKIKAEWLREIGPDIRQKYAQILQRELRDGPTKPVRNTQKNDHHQKRNGFRG